MNKETKEILAFIFTVVNFIIVCLLVSENTTGFFIVVFEVIFGGFIAVISSEI